MGEYLIKKTYRCDNDCEPSGCPSHEAVLKFNTVSDSLVFYDGVNRETWENKIYLDLNRLEVFLDLLKDLSKRDCYVERILKELNEN